MDIENLVKDLYIASALNEEFGELMGQAAEALVELSRDRDSVVRDEATKLEKLSQRHYDDAHGKNFAQWEKEARIATRLRIAAEVLKDYVNGDLNE